MSFEQWNAFVERTKAELQAEKDREVFTSKGSYKQGSNREVTERRRRAGTVTPRPAPALPAIPEPEYPQEAGR